MEVRILPSALLKGATSSKDVAPFFVLASLPPEVLVKRDKSFMREALIEAERARSLGEVPVGAVVVHRGQIISRGFNRREAWRDPSAHAEHIAIRRAAEVLGDWRLNECTLFVTLEPCPMCAGTIINARVGRVVFGALDAKAGAVRSVYAMLEDPRLNHRSDVATCMAEPCAEILREFFQSVRDQR